MIEDALRGFLRRGHALADEDESEEAVARTERQARRDRLEHSGVLERMDEDGVSAVVSDRLGATAALQWVRTWMLAPRPALVLLGEPGVGKTIAAAWALTQRPGRYIRAEDLCEMRKEGGRRGRELYQAMLRPDLLVLDELGGETDLPLAAKTLQDVVDVRQRVSRRTLIMGNLKTRAELVSRYDKRTLDRLGVDRDEDGIAVFRFVDGPSMRKTR